MSDIFDSVKAEGIDIYIVTYPEYPWVDRSAKKPRTPDWNRGHVMVYQESESEDVSKWTFLCAPDKYLFIPDRNTQHARDKFKSIEVAKRVATCEDCRSWQERNISGDE